MAKIEFECLPTMIGTMPHTKPNAALSLVTRYLKDVPAWPQLPNRSYLENMYVQYSEGFPGVVVSEPDRSIYVDRSRDLQKPLETLYAAYLENDVDRYPVSRDYAPSLHGLLALEGLSPIAAKGHITGPVTWGLTVADNEKRPVAYDDTLADAAAKLLRLKAAWQERELKRLSPNTIIFVDEPSMASFGSIAMQLSSEKVISLLDEVFGGISGLKGVHCCGNTDWPVLLATTTDIISFDAYNYGQSLSLYPEEVKKFLDRQGTIAWGIIPNDEATLPGETAASLQDRLEEAMAPFTRKGVRFEQLLRQSLLTPCCGLASLADNEAAILALELLVELSERIRKRRR